jgi:hypothetical protein
MALNFGENFFPRRNIYDGNGNLLTDAIKEGGTVDAGFTFSDTNALIESNTERAGKNKTLIFKEGTATAGTTTIYTVPANKELHITGFFIAGELEDTAIPRSIGVIDNTGAFYINCKLGIAPANESTSGELSISLPIPLILAATQTIRTHAGTNASSHGGFAGWLEDV